MSSRRQPPRLFRNPRQTYGCRADAFQCRCVGIPRDDAIDGRHPQRLVAEHVRAASQRNQTVGSGGISGDDDGSIGRVERRQTPARRAGDRPGTELSPDVLVLHDVRPAELVRMDQRLQRQPALVATRVRMSYSFISRKELRHLDERRWTPRVNPRGQTCGPRQQDQVAVVGVGIGMWCVMKMCPASAARTSAETH